ncbi:MAG TPA: hypothetical protein VMO47_11975 [Rhodothermales bacterium]|nr:hypothetical protein [Rhodothermales bacterium]
METTSVTVLLISTAAIAFIHALAPDHWIPFVSIGRAQRWSRAKLMSVTLVSGVGHVGSSLGIGALGLFFGFRLTALEAFETQRAEFVGLLLIGFGIAYALWGIRHAREHRHETADPKKQVTVWALFALFVLGPCEPLIPLLFVAAADSWHAVLLVSGIFTVITLGMMLIQVLLAHEGVGRFKLLQVSHHHGHAIAGAVIAISGAMVMVFGV